LSSHILPEVAQICQRVLIINKGQIVATDTPSNLTSQLQKSAHVSLTVKGDPSAILPHLESLDGVEKVTCDAGKPGRMLVESDRSRDLRSEIARVVIGRGADLLELKLMDLSLEDIFMQLVTEETSQEDTPS
jgi:ABC-2 type transport system ATP-binding protein